MKCDEFEELISSYIDGEISESDALRLKEHLAVCERCRETLSLYGALFSEAEKPLPPPELFSRVMDGVRTGQVQIRRGGKGRPYAWILTAAACICLCVFGAGKLKGMPEENRSQDADGSSDQYLYGSGYNSEAPSESSENGFEDWASNKLNDDDARPHIIYIDGALPNYIESPVSKTLPDGNLVIYPTEEELALLDGEDFYVRYPDDAGSDEILDGHFAAIVCKGS